MLKLNRLERETFKYHAVYSLLNGIMYGGLWLQEIISRKTLHSSNLVITFISMVWPVANLFSIYWGNFIEGRQDRKNLFVLAAFLGRLSLLTVFFVKTGVHLLILLIFVYSFNAFIIPVQNSIFQENYREEKRGILFGLSIAINTFGIIISSITIGKLLDLNEYLFRPIYAICGISGFFSVLLLSKIPIRVKPKKERAGKVHPLIKPIVETIREFKENRDFFIYEIAFMIYGMGFLMVIPIIPQFLVDKLNMTYTQISFARLFIGQVFMMILLPFAGFYFTKINPVPYTSLSFFILGLYPLLLSLSIFQRILDPKMFVYISYMVYSIGMAGVNTVWFLGSIYFAGDRDAAVLQSVHVTMTGIRGLFAPPLGYFIMTRFSDIITFITSSAFFIFASVILLGLHIRRRFFTFSQ